MYVDLSLTSERYRPREYETDDGPWDPISGGASALLGTIASLTMGVADFPIEIFRTVKRQQTKHQERVDSMKENSNSDNSTPQGPSRSDSQVDLSSEVVSEPQSYLEDSSMQESSPSAKTSYESTLRSSTETPASDTPLSSTTSFQRGSSLKQALRGTLERARSRSRDRDSGSRSNSRSGSRCSSPFRSEPKEFDPSQLTLENATRAGKGISRIVGAGLKSPMDFTLGIARGFHNAPKLYGDDTVRTPEKVTDFQSGLKAAGKVSYITLSIFSKLTKNRGLDMVSTMELQD